MSLELKRNIARYIMPNGTPNQKIRSYIVLGTENISLEQRRALLKDCFPFTSPILYTHEIVMIRTLSDIVTFPQDTWSTKIHDLFYSSRIVEGQSRSVDSPVGEFLFGKGLTNRFRRTQKSEGRESHQLHLREAKSEGGIEEGSRTPKSSYLFGKRLNELFLGSQEPPSDEF